MTAPTPRNYSNVTSRGTLTSSVAPGDATLLTTGFTNLPAVPFTITLDRNTVTEEVCLVTAVVGDVLTVVRGYDGTAGASHLAGAYVEHTAVARDFREANQHTNATEAVHGTTGSLVGTEGSQTLIDKTLLSPIVEADAALGDAVVAWVPPGAESRYLFRGMDPDGDDVALIDAFGAAVLKSVSVSDAPAAVSSLTRRDYVDSAVSGLNTRLTAAEGTLANATESVIASRLVKRDSNGYFDVASAVGGNQPARKSQVDSAALTAENNAKAYADTQRETRAKGLINASLELTTVATSGTAEARLATGAHNITNAIALVTGRAYKVVFTCRAVTLTAATPHQINVRMATTGTPTTSSTVVSSTVELATSSTPTYTTTDGQPFQVSANVAAGSAHVFAQCSGSSTGVSVSSIPSYGFGLEVIDLGPAPAGLRTLTI
jgi:hypothetical protein